MAMSTAHVTTVVKPVMNSHLVTTGKKYSNHAQ